MQLISFNESTPKFDATNFIATGAILIGKLELKKHVNIWFNSVLRADINFIFIDESTNIQDLCVLHVTKDFPLVVGKNVTVGHSCTLHGCSIGDGSLIGMGSTILDGAVVGAGSIVAAGTVITPGKIFPDGVMIMGMPGKVVRELSQKEKEDLIQHAQGYVKTAKIYLETGPK